MEERWKDVYEEEVVIYDAFSRAEDAGDRVLQALLHNAVPEGKVVLDAGCGSGRYAARLAPYCRRFIGLDLSRALLRYARAQGRQGTNVDFVQARFEEIPLRDGSVDLVISTWAVDPLSFSPQRPDPTVEMSRVCGPQGDIWLVVNHWQGEFMEMRGEQEQETTRLGLRRLQERGFSLVEKIETALQFEDLHEARRVMGFIFGQKALDHLQSQRKLRLGRVVALLHKG